MTRTPTLMTGALALVVSGALASCGGSTSSADATTTGAATTAAAAPSTTAAATTAPATSTTVAPATSSTSTAAPTTTSPTTSAVADGASTTSGQQVSFAEGVGLVVSSPTDKRSLPPAVIECIQPKLPPADIPLIQDAAFAADDQRNPPLLLDVLNAAATCDLAATQALVDRAIASGQQLPLTPAQQTCMRDDFLGRVAGAAASATDRANPNILSLLQARGLQACKISVEAFLRTALEQEVGAERAACIAKAAAPKITWELIVTDDKTLQEIVSTAAEGCPAGASTTKG